jgi:hypothetical protein
LHWLLKARKKSGGDFSTRATNVAPAAFAAPVKILHLTFEVRQMAHLAEIRHLPSASAKTASTRPALRRARNVLPEELVVRRGPCPRLPLCVGDLRLPRLALLYRPELNAIEMIISAQRFQEAPEIANRVAAWLWPQC